MFCSYFEIVHEQPGNGDDEQWFTTTMTTMTVELAEVDVNPENERLLESARTF
jgi:hypothetical protein